MSGSRPIYSCYIVDRTAECFDDVVSVWKAISWVKLFTQWTRKSREKLIQTPEAPFFRERLTAPEAFLEMLDASGLRSYAQTHLKKALFRTHPFGEARAKYRWQLFIKTRRIWKKDIHSRKMEGLRERGISGHCLTTWNFRTLLDHVEFQDTAWPRGISGHCLTTWSRTIMNDGQV